MLEEGKNLGTFDSKTKRCIFIGNSLEFKAYRLGSNGEKSSDIKFLNDFQKDEGKTWDDFIDIDIMNHEFLQ